MHHGKFNGIQTDKANIVAIEAKCHSWLKKHRKGYYADRWSPIIENPSARGQYTIPLPPEKDTILSAEELSVVVEGPLPAEWFPPEQPMI